MDSIKRNARAAGFLYLLVAITGPFVLMYVPGKLFVPGNATATAANILAHETLFRARLVVGLFSELCFVLLVLALYRLLTEVSVGLATVMAVTVPLDAPLAFLRIVDEVAALAFLRAGEILAAFDKPQRDAVAAVLIDINGSGILVSEMFWGLWLLPLGLLVYRSTFIPRLLGIWLFVNGLAYVAISSTGLLWPQHADAVFTYTMPVLFGEVALMLWLLVVGARVPPAAVAPSSQAAPG